MTDGLDGPTRATSTLPPHLHLYFAGFGVALLVAAVLVGGGGGVALGAIGLLDLAIGAVIWLRKSRREQAGPVPR